MGTYTTNYNLYKPAPGETGWGSLVNGNFDTSDTQIKSYRDKAVHVVKEVGQPLYSSTALQDDDELKFDIGTSESWAFQFIIFYSVESGVPGIKLALNGPAGVTKKIWIQYMASDEGSIASGEVKTAWDDALARAIGSAQTYEVAIIRGSLVSTTSSGTVVLRWAQNTSSGDGTSVLHDSSLAARKV